MRRILNSLLPLALSFMLVAWIPMPDHEPVPDPVMGPWEEIALLLEIASEIEEAREVEERQERLADLGWYEGMVDGIVGPLTLAAREGFQEAAGLEPDGEVTPEFVEVLFSDDAPAAPEPEPEPAPVPQAAPSAPQQATQSTRNVWDRLAECESGLWVNGGASFVEGSARWDYRYGIYRGGLQFDQPSWDWASEVGGHGMVGVDPANTSRETQIRHAETLLAIHPAGWGAWPTCSRMLGLR